ncbi:hypothetical protein [Nocardiopsis kunsanensis]|uniref:hypothetical protein n=1 Tax=Nocardiopsis kunsanensis TaxID=141693 RepID=UPI00034DB98B|nr:hypothetical protein [Nocardiopsis kunsanensis]
MKHRYQKSSAGLRALHPCPPPSASRLAASIGAFTLAATLAPSPAAAEEAQNATPTDVIDTATVGDWTTLTYEDGSAFSSTPAIDGSFNWNAEFQIGIESREYSTPTDGTHSVEVDSVTNCDPNYDTVTITLYRDRLVGWTNLGEQTVDCSGGTATWTGVEGGTFYWYMRANGSWSGIGDYDRVASGTTTYP